MERAKVEQFETITTENFEAASKHLGRLIWEGTYDEALSLRTIEVELLKSDFNSFLF